MEIVVFVDLMTHTLYAFSPNYTLLDPDLDSIFHQRSYDQQNLGLDFDDCIVAIVVYVHGVNFVYGTQSYRQLHNNVKS